MAWGGITRLEWHVLIELLQSFGVAVSAMTLLMIIGGAYEPIREGLSLATVVQFIPLLLPYSLPWTIPTAFVAACIMVYSRMAGNNELTAVRASGVHLWRILSPAAMVALLLSATCGMLNHEWEPRTRLVQYNVIHSVSASEQAAALQRSDPVMRIGSFNLYIGDMFPDNSFRDAVIVMTSKASPVSAGGAQRKMITYVRAPRGRYEYSDERSEIIFYLEHDPSRNTESEPDAGKAMLYKLLQGGQVRDFESAEFERCELPLKLKSLRDVDFVPSKAKHMTSTELMLRIAWHEDRVRQGLDKPPNVEGLSPSEQLFRQKGYERWMSRPRRYQTDLHGRATLALAPLLLGAIAVPLGILTRRGRRLVAFALAIAVVLGAYYPMMTAATAIGESGLLPPPLAMWGMTGIIAAVAAIMMRKILKW
jgi:lipopolysaccharide export system permease protein